MRKLRDWRVIPDEELERVSLKLLIDGEAPDEPQHLIDQARAWLKEHFGPAESKQTEGHDG